MVNTSIIIVNYKVKEELLECLNSIYNSKPKILYEIIVVDNDENKSLNKDLSNRFPKVKYIKSPKNLGYGAGNNLGAKHAKGEYLFFLNPDTKIKSGNIAELIGFYERNEKVGIVAPLLLNKENKPYDLQGTKELNPKRAIFALSFVNKLFPRNRFFKDYYNTDWNKKTIKEVDVVPGTAFLIKKELFEQIGGFDEKFFLFFEEFDLCRRVRKQGFKNYITPQVKVFHKWGASTAKNRFTQAHFRESRSYYFKKNFSLTGQVTDLVLRINKEALILFGILVTAIFLRFYKLSEIMSFIPDIGWFYVSARDLMVSHQIPLVGIATSHPWLHQGPLWTYILTAVLVIFKNNPVAPAYVTAILDIGTLLMIYFFAKKMFGARAAFISSFFYAISPLIISSAQTPYHTSIIPFFTVLLLIAVFNWIKGKYIYFPISLFLLVLLYNLEIATFSLGIVFVLILASGLLRKKNWVGNILKPRIILLSIVSILIPMTPMLIYDLTHGFPQTLKFVIWTFYRVAVFFGYPPLHPEIHGETWNSFFTFIFSYVQRMFFLPNKNLAIIILIVCIGFAIYKIKNERYKNNLVLTLIFFIVPAISYIAAKTNSAAYFPMFFPQTAILFGYFFASFKNKLAIISLITIVIISIGNLQSFPNRSFSDMLFLKRIKIAHDIVRQSNGKPYNITNKKGSMMDKNAIKNYEYLAWWLGNGPSFSSQKQKYYIDEISSKIQLVQ